MKNKKGNVTASTEKNNGKNVTPLTQKDARMIRRVIKRQESIARKDIADYKLARQQATSTYEPKQVLLQRLYDDVMLDALMTSQVSVLRVGKNQGADYALTSNGEKDEEETTKLKDSGLYEEAVMLIIEALFYNNSVMEFSYGINGPEIELIPRENISPEAGKFYPDVHGSETINYRELPDFGKWLIEVYPRKRDLGLLNKAVPYVLIKKFALSCWSELCEIFGIPPRVMKTNTTDEDMLTRAETMMKEIGSAAYFIIDTTENFEWAQGVATNGDVYRNLIATCDQQLSLLNIAAVLGQDTVNGNRSKEESSTKLMEAVVKADKRLIESTFNKKILPALAAIGFLKLGLRLEIVKEVDIEKLWKMTYEAGTQYDIDPEWVKDTFGIDVTGKKSFDSPAPPPEENDDKGEERDFFPNAPQVGASGGNRLTEFNQALIRRVAGGKAEYWDAELFWFIAGDLLNAIRPVFGKAQGSIGYNAPDAVYTAALEQNLFHFSAAKTLAEIQELNQAFRESKSYKEFETRAAGITDTFNNKWQRTEYRTAEKVAEGASRYRRLKSREKLFPVWRYRTVGDGQVRPSHAALDGLTLPSNDARWKSIYPPNDWACRCWIEALMADEHDGGFSAERAKVDEFMQSAEWKKAAAQGWAVNRAETAEVFTANQMYIKKFPGKAASFVGKLYYNDYGLDSFGKCLAQANRTFVPYAGEAAAWKANNARFTDFSGKTIDMPDDVFGVHTSGRYAVSRVPLLDSIADVLKNPDEVWLNDYKGAFCNLNYIKYYQGKAINVICGVQKGKLIGIETWFEIEDNPKKPKEGKIARSKDPRWKYRRGLLIKK